MSSAGGGWRCHGEMPLWYAAAVSDERDDFATRAARRANWPVRRYDLGAEPDDEWQGTTVEQRLQMMWRLALDAWASSGQPLPSYERAQIPGKVIRRAHDGRSGAE